MAYLKVTDYEVALGGKSGHFRFQAEKPSGLPTGFSPWIEIPFAQVAALIPILKAGAYYEDERKMFVMAGSTRLLTDTQMELSDRIEGVDSV